MEKEKAKEGIINKLLRRPDNTKKANELLKLAGTLAKYEFAFIDIKAEQKDTHHYFNAIRKMCAELILENYKFSNKFNSIVKHFNRLSKQYEKVIDKNIKLKQWKKGKWSRYLKWLKKRNKKKNQSKIKIENKDKKK